MRARQSLLLTAIFVFCFSLPTFAQQTPAKPATAAQPDYLPLTVFYELFADEGAAIAALKKIDAGWNNAYAAMLLDVIFFIPSSSTQEKTAALLEKASGLRYRNDLNPFYEWLWSMDPGQHPQYAEFKAAIYEGVDPRFREYFEKNPRSRIRLDEIRWGGVRRDGIPPLKNPKMIAASAATYLDDNNVIFGVAIDGDVRAYPKRILAWHEMVKDKIGGRELNGVYCTLCGAMILYDTTVNGVQYELGTSGFLYRSNKLMYDHATKSMWSTLTGEPVVGALVGKGIELPTLYVVTTTWKEWKTRHPNTLVLSLETGHDRNYGEGVAYYDYFATDRLMFNVPKLDKRLANKAEVLALRYGNEPLAIAADFLARNRVYQDRTGKTDFVVLTDASGANRVYEAANVKFASWDSDKTARDRAGQSWTVTESELTGANGQRLKRLAGHRSFWFGWSSQFPNTRLVK